MQEWARQHKGLARGREIMEKGFSILQTFARLRVGVFLLLRHQVGGGSLSLALFSKHQG